MSDKMLKFVNIGQQNPPKREILDRKDDFNEEDITKIIQSIEKNETVGIRIPLNIHERKKTDNSYIDDIKKSFVDVYLQKTDMGLGRQDTLRGIMSVSGLRNKIHLVLANLAPILFPCEKPPLTCS